jgi:hypothetical protein
LDEKLARMNGRSERDEESGYLATDEKDDAVAWKVYHGHDRNAVEASKLNC